MNRADQRPETDREVRRRRRFRLLRFGLRTLLVVAVLFSLVFAWIGTNYMRIQREEAAVETLKQAGATIFVRSGDWVAHHPATPVRSLMAIPGDAEQEDWYGRLFGYAGRHVVVDVDFDRDGFLLDSGQAGEALEALAVFSEIEHVSLEGDAFGNETLPLLANVPGLLSVSLADTRVDGVGVAALGPTGVRHIAVSAKAAPDVLSGLSALPELRTVSISGAETTRSDLEGIVSLPHLEGLCLFRVRPSEEGFFAPIARATELRTLDIWIGDSDPGPYPFGDDDVLAIANLERLEALRIDGLTDEGLSRLGPLPSLRWFHIGGPTTAQAVVGFSEYHPDCLVLWGSPFDEKWFRKGKPVETPPEELRWRPFKR